MNKPIDFYSIYGSFLTETQRVVRQGIYGEDIGQNSWITADEYRKFIGWLELTPDSEALEIACGSGGPALFTVQLAGCRLIGIDQNEQGIATAQQMAQTAGMDGRVKFQTGDGNAALPFEDSKFDAVICTDSINHLADRLAVLREWKRVLKPGGRILFTDPVLITGPVTNEELATRSSIGFFLFVPSGFNERVIQEAGFSLIRQEDVSANAEKIAGRWVSVRQSHREDLVKIEGEEKFEGTQRFVAAVAKLTAERRLSRIVYLARK